MLKILVSLLFLNLSVLAADPASCFQIDTGEKFCDLIFKGHARQLWIAGSADLSQVQKAVQPYGVKPVLDKQGRALVSFAFVQYISTTVGPYNEFIVMYAVQRKDQNIGASSALMFTLKNSLVQPDPRDPEYGFYMQKLVLGGSNKKAVQAAIEVGKKGYGFPKISGEVDYDFETPGVFQMSVQSYDGTIKINGQMESSYFGSQNMMSLPVFIHSLTSGLGYGHWSRAVGFAWGGVPQSPKRLKLKIEGSDEITKLQFQPAYVLYTGRYRFDLEGVK